LIDANWDDLRFFLGVIRAFTLSNQPSVGDLTTENTADLSHQFNLGRDCRG